MVIVGLPEFSVLQYSYIAFLRKALMGFLLYHFLCITSITTKYINGIKESVREGIAPYGDGENRTDFFV